MDRLSVSFLIKQLDLHGISSEIHMRYAEIERLSRQADQREAIRLARLTFQLVVSSGHSVAIGITLLQLAQARFRSPERIQRDYALLDGNAAIQWLKHERHNCLIAELLQAAACREDSQWQSAIEHYEHAAHLASDLIPHARKSRQSEQERNYLAWQEAIAARVAQLRTHHHLVHDEAPLPIRLSLPAELVWPEHEPLVWRSQEAEEIRVREIHGVPFVAHSLVRRAQFPRLEPGMTYVVLKLAPWHRSAVFPAQRVLIRLQDNATPEQIVAVAQGPYLRAWVNRFSDIHNTYRNAGMRIIGGEGRLWAFIGGAFPEDDDDSIVVPFGIVEALFVSPQEE